ncbi:hypothetical protein B0T26DRAFT_725940 [Lasiosphaeria miniovina]|uniref:Uncharacterized protein n=1 Tax=Lasiosphaeria miniovina TaxID=1954250 RepID=A0AA39ZZ13_9PEZI|nr:uncharacterized protein B0T26DRAFT_725940 [Lasiosphaeria miniovina]KAK0706253.1 hypothetical protein B0T26DRAFT_725940 [Lasiosphaeria miniovina]
MPEPFSIAIGVIGLPMSTFTFFVSTIQKSDQFRRDFQNAHRALGSAQTQLVMGKMNYRSWKETWCNGPRHFTDDDYVYFWGQEGYDEVRRIVSMMEDSMAELALLLYSSPDFTRPTQPMALTQIQVQKWESELRDLQAGFNPQVGWLGRIASALVGTARLKQCADELKESAGNLAGLSRQLVWAAHFQIEAQPDITNRYLTQMLDRRDLIHHNFKALTRLHRAIEMNRWGIWAVVLRSPDANGGPLSLDTGSVLVNFLASRNSIRNAQETGDVSLLMFEPSLFVVELESVDDTIGAWCDREMLRSAPNIQTHHMYLADTFRFPSHLDSRLRLTGAALGLTNWAFLLWNTPWTQSLCSCCIRFVSVDTSRSTATLQPGQHDPNHLATIITKTRCYKDRGKHIPRKALLLGTSLAEIAIRRLLTIALTSPNGIPRFALGHNPPISANELLGKVRMARDLPFERAVRYCFWYDRERQEGFHPDDIIRFKENVINE